MYRTIDASFWTDPKIQKLQPKERVVFMYLLTGPHSHVGGLYYLPIKYISLHTGLSDRVSGVALDTLSDIDLIRYDDRREVVWVVNMFRYQGRGIKNEQAVANIIPSLHGSPLIDDFLRVYPKVIKHLHPEPSLKKQKIPPSLRYRVLERDGFRCAYCGVSSSAAPLEVDHVVPSSKGGVTEEENLKTSCWNCNSGKSDRVSSPKDRVSGFGTQDQKQDLEREQERGRADSNKLPSTVIIRFPVVGSEGEVEITESSVDEWKSAYPAVDVDQELREMRAWLLANTKKQKTARGSLQSFEGRR